jgi:hypothetical protein
VYDADDGMLQGVVEVEVVEGIPVPLVTVGVAGVVVGGAVVDGRLEVVDGRLVTVVVLVQ